MTADAKPLTAPATRLWQDAPPTPGGQFRAWTDAFERLGYDVDRLLAEIGVARSDFPDPDRLIPCAVVGALFQRAQQIRPLKNQWRGLPPSPLSVRSRSSTISF
jgi:hypothetical protein